MGCMTLFMQPISLFGVPGQVGVGDHPSAAGPDGDSLAEAGDESGLVCLEYGVGYVGAGSLQQVARALRRGRGFALELGERGVGQHLVHDVGQPLGRAGP